MAQRREGGGGGAAGAGVPWEAQRKNALQVLRDVFAHEDFRGKQEVQYSMWDRVERRTFFKRWNFPSSQRAGETPTSYSVLLVCCSCSQEKKWIRKTVRIRNHKS